MFSLFYIGLCLAVGAGLYRRFVEQRVHDILSERAAVPRWMILLPVANILGTMVVTWGLYFSAWTAAHFGHARPLLLGNGVVLGLAMIAAWVWRRELREAFSSTTRTAFGAAIKRDRGELVFFGAVMAGAGLLMWQSLHVSGGKELVVGLSVHSDFGPHLSLIRSFSHGYNFPTEYPHFPDGTMRYHFLFQFLAGNLEYLGLPIDWAFNLPSILAFGSCVMLLYVLAVVITGSRVAGGLAVLFLCFRSSNVWMDYIAQFGSWKEALSGIWGIDQFLGRTAHEDWGLWSQNIFLNQRHLPFGMGILFLVILMMLPSVKAMDVRLSGEGGGKLAWLTRSLCSREAWLPRWNWQALAGPIAVGCILGIAGYWHGSMVLSALLVLACMGIFSLHRLEYVLIPMIAGPVATAQNYFFIGFGQVAVKPEFYWGFLAEHPKTVQSVLTYYHQLLGVMPALLLMAVVYLVWRAKTAEWRRPWWFLIIFISPVILATTVSFTPDIAVNHKYVLVAVILMNIFIAGFIAALLSVKNVLVRALAIAACAFLMMTGVLDLKSVINRNNSERALKLEVADPLMTWVEKNTGTQEVFLSDWHSLHSVLLAGRRLYLGWPYYAWSAGHDTQAREEIVRQIYGGSDPETVRALVKKNGIDYVLIERGNREQKMYVLQEDLLRRLFPVVYEQDGVVILRVGK